WFSRTRTNGCSGAGAHVRSSFVKRARAGPLNLVVRRLDPQHAHEGRMIKPGKDLLFDAGGSVAIAVLVTVLGITLVLASRGPIAGSGRVVAPLLFFSVPVWLQVFPCAGCSFAGGHA